jgi:hypothetical protein
MQISKDGVTKSMLTQYADIDREDAKTFLDTELDAMTHPAQVGHPRPQNVQRTQG